MEERRLTRTRPLRRSVPVRGSPNAGKSAQRGVYVQPFLKAMYVVGMGGMGGIDNSGGMDSINMSGPGNGSGEMPRRDGSGGMGSMGTDLIPVAGDYQFGLMYAAPHVSWNVNITDVNRTSIE